MIDDEARDAARGAAPLDDELDARLSHVG
jgi:hypothetical protein